MQVKVGADGLDHNCTQAADDATDGTLRITSRPAYVLSHRFNRQVGKELGSGSFRQLTRNTRLAGVIQAQCKRPASSVSSGSLNVPGDSE